MGLFFTVCGLGMWLGGVWRLVAVYLLGMMVCLDACGLGMQLGVVVFVVLPSGFANLIWVTGKIGEVGS